MLLLNHEQRRRIVLLRGMVLVAVGGLFLDAGMAETVPGALVLLLSFALSNLALSPFPPQHVNSFRFELGVGAADLSIFFFA